MRAALVVVLALALPSCGTVEKVSTTVSDVTRVINETVKPTLEKVENGVENAQAGLAMLRAERLAAGEDPEGPLGVREILIVLGYFVTGFGVNAARSFTRKRELEKKADKTVGLS